MRRVVTAAFVVSLFVGADPASAQEIVWTRQFGTAEFDMAHGVAVDAAGNTYVVGHTGGTLPGQTSSGGQDAFVRTYDATGGERWTRQFGTPTSDQAQGVAIDASGNVYVSGITNAALPGQTSSGGQDAFVRKYDATGVERWTRQFGTPSLELAFGVAVDTGGNVYVVGLTEGALPGQTSAGGLWDAFVRKYDTSGGELWTRQFGTGAADDASSAAVDAGGNLYVAGRTGGAFPGQTSTGNEDAFVRKYDAAGVELWTRQFGSPSPDEALAVAVDAEGDAYVAGRTGGALPGQTLSGLSDAFVRKYDTSGGELWTRQFGTSGTDDAFGLAATGGNIYVAGRAGGALPGQVSAGASDAFVRNYDAAGSELWTRQFGSASFDLALDVAVNASADVHVVGSTDGALLPGQASLGSADAFVAKFGPTQPTASIAWTRQFGSAVLDVAAGVAAHVSGNATVAGSTNGALPGQTSTGEGDVFVRTYGASGGVMWTRQFGTSARDEGHGVAVDATGNIYVTGLTFGAFPGQALAGTVDALVRKYDPSGSEIWTRQFGAPGLTFAFGVAADASGNIYVAGQTSGTLPGQAPIGGPTDAFVRKYDASGNELWTRQFGSAADDDVRGVAVDASGDVYVAGNTDGALPGQISAFGRDAFVRKYDAAGHELWTRQFGSESNDDALGVASDGSGNAYVVGRARGPLPGQPWFGDRDVFVRKYDPSGNALWTHQFGTALRDEANAVSVGASGVVYVAGETRGALPGQTWAGDGDVFTRAYDTSGEVLWTLQFGTAGLDHARGVAATDLGSAYVAGRAAGALPGQTSAGDVDAFVAKIGAAHADVIPPTTVATLAPAPNPSGWNNTDVTVTLAATDDAGGSGVASITYGASGAQTIAGTEVAGASAGFIISGEGITAVSFAARDVAGNAENASSITVRVDKTPPLPLSAPPDVTADATSPSGAIVGYALPAFSDALDPTPSVVCLPATGTLFPIGSTTVTCTASDRAGNEALTSFAVNVVVSPAQLLSSLTEKTLGDTRLHVGLTQSLATHLRIAERSVADAKTTQACRALSTAEHLLRTPGHAPTPAVIAEYAGDIGLIRGVLGCT